MTDELLLAVWKRLRLTLQLFDQLGELVVEQHLLRRQEHRLRLLGRPRVQLVFGDEAELLHKVLLSNPLLDELLQLISEEDRDNMAGLKEDTACFNRFKISKLCITLA